jgi:uncharacterized protein involved in exopolysaccharide biosynthesis
MGRGGLSVLRGCEMSIIQFLRIFWARRIIIFAATVSCLIGALVVTAILPPRWEAHSRVMLNTLKPDPVTGVIPGGKGYVSTQVELITDYAVARQAVERMHMASDPGLIALYQKRPASDQRDFPRFLADIVINSTKVKLLEDSNILDIVYTSSDPANAKSVVDEITKAYIDASLTFKRDDGERNAAWYQEQAAKAKDALDQATAVLAAYERANHIVLEDDKTDAESARLQVLNHESAPIIMPAAAAPVSSQSSVELATVDAQIATASRTLGPNNPELQALRAKRESLAGLVAKDQQAARSMASTGGGSGLLAQEVDRQKEKVIAQSEQIGRLTQLKQDVDLRRDEYIKMAAKATEFHEEALTSDSGITPLGNAAIPKEPKFPNYYLIVPGSILLGAAVGIFVALLMELLARRVRTPEDLAGLEGVQVVCVVAPLDTIREGTSKVSNGRRRRRLGARGLANA